MTADTESEFRRADEPLVKPFRPFPEVLKLLESNHLDRKVS